MIIVRPFECGCLQDRQTCSWVSSHLISKDQASGRPQAVHSRLQHAVKSSSLPELPPVSTTVLPVRSCPATTCSAVTLLGRSSFSMPYIIWVMLRNAERSKRSHRLNLNSVMRLPPRPKTEQAGHGRLASSTE